MNIDKKVYLVSSVLGIIMFIGYIKGTSFENLLLLLLFIIIIKVLTNTSRVKKLEKEIDDLKNTANKE